jgi:hypothetical protein
MSEWWTYRLDDFLMFAPGTYQRMFALYNAQVWPAPLVALPLGLAVLWALVRRPQAWRLACATVALGWAFTAWAFHWQRYAGIHTAAPWFAAMFALQALMLAWMARPASGWHVRTGPGWARAIGLALLAFAVLLLPWTGWAQGRPWQQAALFGLTPDATAVGTLGLLLVLARVRGVQGVRGSEGIEGLGSSEAEGGVGGVGTEQSAHRQQARSRRPSGAAQSPALVAAASALPWVLPVAWCLVSAATLWTLRAPEAFVLLALTGLAVAVGLAARAVRAGAIGGHGKQAEPT